MKWIVSFLALLSVEVSGSTYYVATNGNDAADGSIGTPWRTIQRAITNAAAGDTISIGAGEFNEYVTLKSSGTAGNPITFRGAGTNLTFVDPSTPFTNGWTAATEIGAGVYKQTGMPFETKELTIGHKRVPFVWTTNSIVSDIAGSYIGSGISNGLQILNLASDRVLTNGNGSFQFWDTTGAIWISEGTTTYLRLRDGSDPNGLDIRCAKNYDGVRTQFPCAAAIWIDGKSYLTFENLAIRGAFCGIYLDNSAHDITIRSNRISNGEVRIYAQTAVSNVTIQANELTCDYYGYANPGAWGEATDTNSVNRAHLYTVSKYLMGNSSVDDIDIWFYLSATGNVVTNNWCHDSIGSPFYVRGTADHIPTGTIVAGNTFENHPSCGIEIGPFSAGTLVFDNLIKDCNSQVRFDDFNVSGETNRSAYIYRNRLWLPYRIANHVFVHLDPAPPAASYHPTVWFYHNSFSGGDRALAINTYGTANGGLTNMYWVNNILSTRYYIDMPSGFSSGAAYLAQFDYNLLAGSYYGSAPAWYGAHNLTNASPQWATNSVPDYLLTDGSEAIDSGEDLPTDYPTLPQDSTVKVGTAWDLGALEYGAPVPPTITVQPLNQSVAVGDTAAFSVTASGTAPLTYQWYYEGSPILGGTSSTLTLSPLLGGMAGQYYVVVSNAAGSATSDTVTLTVTSTGVSRLGKIAVGRFRGR